MSTTLILFIILLSLVGAFTLDSFVFHVIYLVSGAFILGNWWVDRSLSRLTITRKYSTHAFPGEVIPVRLQVSNQGLLPIPWLFMQESLPLEVSNVKVINKAFSLGGKSNFLQEYSLNPRKRGFYPLGPVQVSSGDLLGLSPDASRLGPITYLTVYPRVLSLGRFRIPSRSPMGLVRHHQPIFEDTTRPVGKRNYSPGDSLRRIDWKSTAISNKLHVKLFEPSITLETIIFLDLDFSAYPQKFFYDAAELAIVVAASISNLISTQKQAIGLISNGEDILVEDKKHHSLPPHKGRAHLILILETLARIQLSQSTPLKYLLRQNRSRFPWGTTQIVITGHWDQALLDELYQSHKCGGEILLLLVGDVQAYQEARSKAEILGISCFMIRDERDLKVWQ